MERALLAARGDCSRSAAASSTPHAIRVNTKKGFSTGSYQAKDNEISIWDAKTGHELRRLKGHHEAVRALDLSPDGTLLASGSGDKTVMLWDVAPSLKPKDEPPVSQVSASNSSDGSGSLGDADGSMQAKVAGQSDEASLSESENDQPENHSALATFPDSLCVDLKMANYLQPEACNQDGCCANEIVAWLCGGGSLSPWDDVRLTEAKGGTQRGQTSSSRSEREKTSERTDLFRFDPSHAKSSWLGDRLDVESPASGTSGSKSGGRSGSHSGGSRSTSAKGLGRRVDQFWSRAGKSFDSVSRGGGGAGGGRGGDEGHKEKK